MGIVLFVDDEPGMQDSVSIFLKKQGHTVFVAANYSDAIQRINDSNPDVVVTDLVLPEKSGLDVLQYSRENNRTTPVILITGRGTVETAVQAMRLGAFDYVTKPVLPEKMLELVAHAIELKRKNDLTASLWEDLQRHRDELQSRELDLKETREGYRTLVEVSRDAISIVDHDGQFLFMNNVAANAAGTDTDSCIGKTMWDIFPKGIADSQIDGIRRAISAGEGYTVESITSIKGEPRWYSTSIQPIQGRDGVYSRALVVARDINDQKQAEAELRKSEKRYRELVESIGEGISIIDLSGQFLFVNQATAGIFGLPAEELLQKNISDFCTPDQLELAQTHIDRRKVGEVTEYEVSVVRADKEQRLLLIRGTPWLSDTGEVLGSFGVLNDITEKRHAEKALQESERKYRLLAENSSDVIWTINEQLEFTYVSPSVERIFGYSVEQAKKNRLDEIMPPESLEILSGFLLNQEMSEDTDYETVSKEIVQFKADGTPFWTEVSLVFLKDDKGQIAGIQGVSRDISARRKIQDERELAMEQLREFESIINRSPAVVVNLQFDDRFSVLSVSKNVDQFGYSADELLGGSLNWSDLIFPDDIARHYDRIAESLQKGELDITLQYRIVSKSGELRWVEDRSKILLNENEEPTHVQGIILDVTERDKAIQQLKNSEVKWHNLITLASDGICIVADSKFIYVNEQLEKIMDRAAEKLIGTSFIDYIAPEYQAATFDLHQRHLIHGEQVGIHRTAVLWPDGSQIELELNASVIPYEGKPSQLVVVRDITERVFAERALKESERRYRRLAENAQDIIWRSDVNGKLLFANPAVFPLLGYHPDEARKLAGADYMSEEDVAQIKDWVSDAKSGLQKNIRYKGLLKYRHKNGQEIPFEAYITMIRNEDGEVIELEGISRDISQRINAQRKIEESNIFLESLVMQSPLPMVILDHSGKAIMANASIKELYDVPDEVPPDKIDFLDYAENEKQEINPYIERAFTGDVVEIPEMEVVSPFSGKAAYQRIKLFPIHDHFGMVTHVVLIREDITASKIAADELEKRQWQLKQGQRIAQLGSYVWDLNSGEMTLSDECARIIGISSDGMMTNTFTQFLESVHPDDREYVERATEWSVSNHQTLNLDYRIVRPSGEVRTISSRAELISSDNDALATVVGFAHDITERKRMEQELFRNASALRALFNATQDMAFLMDKEGTLLVVNQIFAKRFNQKPTELVGINIFDLLGPEDEEPRRAGLERVVHSGKPLQVLDKYGDVILEDSLYPIHDENKEISRIAVFVRDITDRKRAEVALQRSEERYRTYVNSSPIGIFVLDSEAKFLDVNPQACRMTGYSRGELLELSIQDMVSSNELERQREHFEELQKSGKAIGEFLCLSKNGKPYYISVEAVRLEKDRFIAFSVDVTIRHRAEEELLQNQGQLRSLTSELTLAEERQRRYIASVIHDGLCQDLASVLTQMKLLREDMTENSLINDVSRVIELTAEMVQQARSLSFDLSPPALNELELPGALHWLFEKLKRDTELLGEFHGSEEKFDIPEDMKVLIYQVARELLLNIQKHARASRIGGRIANLNNTVILRIEDNGVGFVPSDTNTVSLSPDQVGFGLFSIRERLQYIGGSMMIDSAPNHGTRITVMVPLVNENEALRS